MKRAIDFLITQKCNYRCEYCLQSKKFTKGGFENASNETIEAFLAFLSEHKPEFEVTISGGEPFCHPKFFYFAQNVVNMGNRVSVVSNFSYPIESYKKLKDMVAENLTGLFVSLHLGQVGNLDNFLHKAELFNGYKGNTEFTVGAVLSDENCAVLKKVDAALARMGVKFELQHMRIGNSFVQYRQREAAEFIKNFPIYELKEKSSAFGSMCCAGRDFMLVYQNGECYRCYSSRFNRIHSMGNIKDKNFKMFSDILPCLNWKCTCPKPVLSGMIDFENRAPVKSAILSLYNALWLPYYGVKNFEILKTKLFQILKFKKQG